jgi:AraC-like DNA-binding protein
MATDLTSLAMRFAPRAGLHDTPLGSLQLVRADAPYERVHSMHKPSLCFIVQGTKLVTVADETLRYGPGQFLFSSVELPISGEVVEATRSRPYIVLVLSIEPSAVFELAASAPPLNRTRRSERAGIFVGEDAAIADAFRRLLLCLSDAADVAVLAPMVVRELVYRLLRGPWGDDVREAGIADSHTQRIARVIEHLKREFARPQRSEELAHLAGMSVSSFHAHFRKVTRLTPLQYQKELQLHEARRLMLSSAISAADAGYRVGYESASQFSREYARHFGLPPLSDVRRTQRTARTARPRVGA